MLPLSLILSDTRACHLLENEGCKINQLLFMDDLKLHGKNSSQAKLQGQFVGKIRNIAHEFPGTWIRNWFLKKDTEGMLFAAEEQALRTNSNKAKIDKQTVSVGRKNIIIIVIHEYLHRIALFSQNIT